MSGQKKRSFLNEALKRRVVFDQECAEKTWKILEHVIHEIYNQNLSSFRFEEMYRHAYNMLVHNFGEKLYSGLVTTMTYHVKEMSKSIEAAQGELLLEELNRNWAEHNKAVQMIRDILVYMVLTFIPSTHKTPLHELGLNLWRDVVISASKTRSRPLDTLLELVHRERSGEVINRGLMRNIIKMLMDLGSTVYQDDFEKHFLEVSADFYRCESQEFMESCNCGNYLKKAERRLTEEMERVSHYLDARSEAKITNVVEKEMIESHMNRLVHMESSGLVNMLVDDKYDDLGRMYRLFRRVQNGLVIVQDVMTAYIRDTGMQLVTDPEMLRDPVDFVQRLLDLKDKYDKVISLAFNNDKTFQNALNSSFEYFINLNARCPEFICLFVDDKLRKGLRGLGEEDVGVILDKVMMLVCYLQENDKEMIEGHMNRLVHMESSGLVNMLVDDKYDDLGRMYSLFRWVQNGLVILQDVVTAYIRDTGTKLVTDPEMLRDPVDFVQRLLDLKDKYDRVISLAFNNDKTFQNALNSSFEYFINLSARCPEFICLFVDDKLRKGLRGVSEEDVEVILDKVPMLVCYLQENDKEMIEGHMNRLVYMESSGLGNMLVDDKYDDLGRMYSLFRRVHNGLVIVRDVMAAYIRDTGKQLVTDPERLRDPIDFVQHLLDLKDKYDKFISLAFNNDKTFQNALNSSFEYFINLNSRSPEFISLFVDDKLRKGLRGVSEEDVEVVLDKVMMIFRYLQEKDVFEKYYKQHLAKRLLSGKTVSDDAERSLIVKLKTECGYQYTCKLERMFTDMKISQDTMHGFYSTVGPQLGNSPTLTVQVLTTGSWPTQPSATCNLPAEILWVCEKFKSYYLGTHTGRRLSWQTNMGTADLKSTFGKGQKHELNVSTYQLCVLMLFNNADRLTYKEIEQATEIPAVDLKRCLQSLACVKGKNVLRKEPMSKDIAEEDTFFFNDKFTSKFFNIKIGTVVAQRETEPENAETRHRVEEDRKPQIEAAIVRMMKSRRVLDHNNIVAEVTKQLQGLFLPNPVVIKRRIESLIEREFLERDKTDGQLYRYLA